ncbi:FAD-binding protein [Ancylobacter sp. Lp-2]|uniref:FAD-binding protein n=1 Tax=Ancylobacter sp. Lp-2 TaxID=2881339 RepID=UPI00351CC861|nr:FAD-binding protein [Ancylobacter sp. Lp-2]
MATSQIRLKTDVLVIGGGPAGIWVALSIAEARARMVTAEKDYVGASSSFSSANAGADGIKPDDPAQSARRPDPHRQPGAHADHHRRRGSRRVGGGRGAQGRGARAISLSETTMDSSLHAPGRQLASRKSTGRDAS